MANNWRPIETAPKDGSSILLFIPGFECRKVYCGYWDDDRYAAKPKPYWSNDAERWLGKVSVRSNTPSHWMPFPDPPTDATEITGHPV